MSEFQALLLALIRVRRSPLFFLWRASPRPSAAETNRKCPRWAEFNQGTPPLPTPSATSPPATSPTGTGSFSFGAGSDSLFSPGASSSLRPGPFAGSHGPSPLATSPPMVPMDEDDDEVPATPSGAPKIKLTLKKT